MLLVSFHGAHHSDVPSWWWWWCRVFFFFLFFRRRIFFIVIESTGGEWIPFHGMKWEEKMAGRREVVVLVVEGWVIHSNGGMRVRVWRHTHFIVGSLPFGGPEERWPGRAWKRDIVMDARGVRCGRVGAASYRGGRGQQQQTTAMAHNLIKASRSSSVFWFFFFSLSIFSLTSKVSAWWWTFFR